MRDHGRRSTRKFGTGAGPIEDAFGALHHWPSIAAIRTLSSSVTEIEEHFRVTSAGWLGAPDCAIRFRRHTTLLFIASDGTALSVGQPHLRVTRWDGPPMPMCSRGVLVHYSSRLGAATPVLVVEVPRGDGVSAKRTLELAKALHHRNGV